MIQLESIDNIFKKFAAKLDKLSLEEINKIPEGFNNNIIWNFGHIVVSSYSLTFIRPNVDKDYQIPFWDKYKLGSKPETAATQDEFDQLKSLAFDYSKTVLSAIEESRFTNITPYSTGSFGVELKTMDDILTTILAHNALHFGTASAMTRIVQQ